VRAIPYILGAHGGLGEYTTPQSPYPAVKLFVAEIANVGITLFVGQNYRGLPELRLLFFLLCGTSSFIDNQVSRWVVSTHHRGLPLVSTGYCLHMSVGYTWPSGSVL